jgi:hypothetical protein
MMNEFDPKRYNAALMTNINNGILEAGKRAGKGIVLIDNGAVIGALVNTITNYASTGRFDTYSPEDLVNKITADLLRGIKERVAAKERRTA